MNQWTAIQVLEKKMSVSCQWILNELYFRGPKLHTFSTANSSASVAGATDRWRRTLFSRTEVRKKGGKHRKRARVNSDCRSFVKFRVPSQFSIVALPVFGILSFFSRCLKKFILRWRFAQVSKMCFLIGSRMHDLIF